MLSNSGLKAKSLSNHPIMMLRAYVTEESRVCVDLLPSLRVIDRMIMVHRVIRGLTEALVHACNLTAYRLRKTKANNLQDVLRDVAGRL